MASLGLRFSIPPHPLHISQQLPKKRMSTKRGRIAQQQQLAPCAGHAHVHAANGRQESDLALAVSAGRGDGHDAALLALPRIAGAHAEPALQPLVILPSVAPCAPRHARPRRLQSAGLFAWLTCPATFDAGHHALGRAHACGHTSLLPAAKPSKANRCIPILRLSLLVAGFAPV